MINDNDSPLWNAIKRLAAAKRRNAAPKMIERLEARVSAEAAKVAAVLGPNWEEVASDRGLCKHGVPFEHPTEYCQVCLREAMRGD